MMRLLGPILAFDICGWMLYVLVSYVRWVLLDWAAAFGHGDEPDFSIVWHPMLWGWSWPVLVPRWCKALWHRFRMGPDGTEHR